MAYVPPRWSWTVGRVRGIPVQLHASLALVLPLLAAAFAIQFRALSAHVPLLMPPMLWGLLVAGALFASVVVHELAHSLVALATGGKVRAISVMFIGGVSELVGQAPRPRVEAVMAAVGPVASLVLGGLLYVADGVIGSAAPADLRVAIRLLALLNVALGVFNLLPAFPLDGGRVLRALLAGRLGRVRGTAVAATVGKLSAAALGVIGFYFGDLLAMFVAAFIYLGADRETARARLEEELEGISVAEVMSSGPLTLAPDLSVAQAAEQMYAARVDVAVVDAVPAFAITVRDLAQAPEGQRGDIPVAALTTTTTHVAAPREPLRAVLARMAEDGLEALPVIDVSGRVLGIVRMRDVERELALRRAATAERLAPHAHS